MRTRGNTQDDYILRLIQQAANALRVLRHRLMGTSDSPEGIRAGAEAAIGALLGTRATLIEKLDAASAAQLVGHPEHVTLWADLIDVEADALDRLDDPTGAAKRRQRARELRSATDSIWGPL
jgi:hypothetical protein